MELIEGGISTDDRLWAVYNANATELLRSAEVAKVPPTLIFMDPPFNQGEQYDTWDDNIDRGEFFEHLSGWIGAAADAVAADGSIWLNLPDEWAADAVVLGRDQYDLHLENWVMWHYRFGQCRRDRFIRSKQHGIWFSKGE